MDEAINVLHICGRFRIGGITTFVKSMVKLNKQFTTNHDLLFIFEAKENNIQHYCQVHNLNFKWKKFFSSFKKVNNILNGYNAILIHAAHPSAVLPLLFSNKKKYLFQHGMAVRHGFFVKKMLKKTWYSLLPILLNAKIIFSSEYAIRKARTRGIILQRRRSIIIPFGVEIIGKNRKIRNIKRKRNINVGMANALVEDKRNDLVLQSLGSYCGSRKINLKIAGCGPQLSYLKEIAKNIDNENVKIDFLGEIFDMDDFYDDLDLFILPSKDESLGLVVLEAISRAIPVIVFQDVGGCLYVIQDGKNGFILRNGVESLELIWSLFNKNPGTVHRMSEYISKLNMDEYNVVNSRLKLDNFLVLNNKP